MILGHMGEGLIHWLYRIDFSYKKAWMDEEIRPRIQKAPSRYIMDNFIVTTSGMTAMPAFLSTYLDIGADRIMFSADYPYEKSEEAAAFIERIPVSGEDKEKILYRNAERIFNIS